ncbi:MAG TPA: hypothetical protein VNY05_05590 [Candidatus Acidoferrales bacterium]|nr:hypothetical protein [Candidatus Acidoferrales bacterium]
MTDGQLYLSVGIPTLAVIVSLIVNLAQQDATNRRIGRFTRPPQVRD